MTALEKCSQKVPDLVLISSHFSVTDSLKLLETLKNRSVKKLVPIIFVVDFNQRIIILPGTTWAGQIGLLHPFSSEAEI
jgi:PleD family two-component response regulator